jgi:glycosyltransferase involved in cell wall biosynthesis
MRPLCVRETYQTAPETVSRLGRETSSPWPVGVAVLARDEERCIQRCLDSILPSAPDTVVVLDTGSTDKTLERVAGYRAQGVEVVHVPWRRSFAAARNAALERAQGGWVVFLDADEWLTDDTARRLLSCLRACESIAGVEYSTLAPTIHEAHAGENFVDIPRIVPAWNIRFTGEVHEYPYITQEPALIPGLIGIDLDFYHDGYHSPVVHAKQKPARNRELLRLAREREPHNPRWLYYSLRDGGAEMSAQAVVDTCVKLAHADATGPGDRHAPTTYRRNTLALACSRLASLGAWPRVVEYCNELDSLRGQADAAYFRGLHELVNGLGPNEGSLLSVVRARKDPAALAVSGIDSDGRHLDAVIAAHLLGLRGKDAANSYLELCEPWSDAFFDSSRLRGY